MISQLQVICNQERKHTGLVTKTSYKKKKGIKTTPGTLPLGLAEEAIRSEDIQVHGTVAQKTSHFTFKAEASSADVKKKVTKLPCNKETLNQTTLTEATLKCATNSFSKTEIDLSKPVR